MTQSIWMQRCDVCLCILLHEPLSKQPQQPDPPVMGTGCGDAIGVETSRQMCLSLLLARDSTRKEFMDYTECIPWSVGLHASFVPYVCRMVSVPSSFRPSLGTEDGLCT